MIVIRWLLRLLRIETELNSVVKEGTTLQSRVRRLESDLADLTQIIKERTTLAVDVGFRGDPNIIIAVGRFQGQDYVQTFSLEGDADMHEIISRLKQMEKYATVRRVDAPPQMRAAFMRDLRI